MSWYEWRPYVPVAVRRARSLGKMEKLRKKGLDIQPVVIGCREIARTFWGRAWCHHLEKFSDFANRLPRGRTYVRNGSVCHLEIAEGAVKAMVSGSELYNVDITIKKLPGKKWSDVKNRCAGEIGSLLELLQGKLSKSVMSVVTDRDKGLFPLPAEISLKCDCPDWAVMCKHVAAALYGVGARLDEKPELLFLLRGVDHEDLVSAEIGLAVGSGAEREAGRNRIAEADLSHVFGIEMSDQETEETGASAADRTASAVKGKPRHGKASGPKNKSAASGKGKKEGRVIVRAHKTSAKKAAAGDRKASRRSVALSSGGTKAKKELQVISKTPSITGGAVSKLRKKFNMSQGQFARLLGVSLPTICNWEKKEGALNLQTRTRDMWSAVASFTKEAAWSRLAGS